MNHKQQPENPQQHHNSASREESSGLKGRVLDNALRAAFVLVTTVLVAVTSHFITQMNDLDSRLTTVEASILGKEKKEQVLQELGRLNSLLNELTRITASVEQHTGTIIRSETRIEELQRRVSALEMQAHQ